jgi:ATP-dependent HslUV protease ATP-binding subunit HslU
MGHLIDLFILDFLLGPDNLPASTREAKLSSLRSGLYDDFQVTIELPRSLDDLRFSSISSYLSHLTTLSTPLEGPVDRQTVSVARARQIMLDYYLVKMHFRIDLKKSAIEKIENEGIVVIDEIDKIVHSKNSVTSGRSPSTEGVQRDLLPIIEGTLINTKFGDVNTSHVLFVCSGAFSNSKPGDLMPELLGRLPLRIDLKSLGKLEFGKILRDVEFSLLEQYRLLMETEGIEVRFEESGVDYVCERELFFLFLGWLKEIC